jgi:hypothetical protein
MKVFNFEYNWWRFFQKLVVRTELDAFIIVVFC